MSVVCGVCIYKSVEKHCSVLMPDCEHVFDMACIENSLGLEYTCPECQRVYLLPSPYRPTNLSADNSEHQEYVRLRKSVAEANQETNALKVELSKVICEIAICNEVLATANNALEILMLESHDTGSSKRNPSPKINSLALDSPDNIANAPAAHVRIKTTEIEANPFKNSTLADFEQIQSQCIIAQRNCNEFLDKKKGNIQETSMKWESSNQNILKKLCSLKTIANTATERLQASQSSTKALRVDRKNLLLKLNILAQMADNMQRQFELENETAFELQQKVSSCNKKMNELKGLEKRLYMTNQQLQTKKEKLVASLPDEDTMNEYQTASTELQITKQTNALMSKHKQTIKSEKLGEKLCNMLRDTKGLEKEIRAHAASIKQAEKLARSLKTMNLEIFELYYNKKSCTQ